MTDDPDHEEVRSEAKWNGETVDAREERILDWCVSEWHAMLMYHELQGRLDRYREERLRAEESCADELRTINALKRKIHEEGWDYEVRRT